MPKNFYQSQGSNPRLPDKGAEGGGKEVFLHITPPLW